MGIFRQAIGGPAWLFALALAVALAPTQAAFAQGAVKSVHKDWQIRCDTPPGAKSEQCALIQSVTAEDRANVGLTVIVLKTADAKNRLMRVVAPLDVRRQRLVQGRGYDEKTAEQAIAEQDRARHDFLRHHFHCSLEGPCSYDVVINTGQIGLSAAADFIIELAGIKLAIPLGHDPYPAPAPAQVS